MNANDVPIFINSYNRLNCLKEQITALEKRIPNKIIILDNASTYEPLLDYYKSIPHEIVYLEKNLGHQALWISKHINNYRGQYYVLTDPDVVPVEECPADFIQHFMNLMEQFPEYKKVGFNLKIDDIPDHYPHKASVLSWEDQYWHDRVGNVGYRGPIDTTFALFHPTIMTAWNWSIRTDYPYLARHTTWYLDPNNLSDDEKYYRDSEKTLTHWSKAM